MWQTAGIVAVGVLAWIGLSVVIAVPVCLVMARTTERERAMQREAERTISMQRLAGGL
jgi:hypothetical protein